MLLISFTLVYVHEVLGIFIQSKSTNALVNSDEVEIRLINAEFKTASSFNQVIDLAGNEIEED